MFNAASKSQPAKTSNKKAAPARDANAVTILTSGCHFSGKLYCRGASRIAGRIEGQLISEGLLVIEEEAQVTAEVKADEVVIQGSVQGKLHATGRVELTASSQFEGDIVTPVLIVREGAQFNGHATMVRKEEPSQTGKTPRIVAVGGKPNVKTPELDVRNEPAPGKTPDINVSNS